MTTKAAAAQYEAEHVASLRGKPLAVFNPHDKPVAELPVIYGWNNGGSEGWYHAVLLAEDGTGMVCLFIRRESGDVRAAARPTSSATTTVRN